VADEMRSVAQERSQELCIALEVFASLAWALAVTRSVRQNKVPPLFEFSLGAKSSRSTARRATVHEYNSFTMTPFRYVYLGPVLHQLILSSPRIQAPKRPSDIRWHDE
jgi:hypothetical protein